MCRRIFLTVVLVGLPMLQQPAAGQLARLPQTGTRADALRQWAMRLLSQGETTWGQAALYQLAARNGGKADIANDVQAEPPEAAESQERSTHFLGAHNELGTSAMLVKQAQEILAEHRAVMRQLRQDARLAQRELALVGGIYRARIMRATEGAAAKNGDEVPHLSDLFSKLEKAQRRARQQIAHAFGTAVEMEASVVSTVAQLQGLHDTLEAVSALPRGQRKFELQESLSDVLRHQSREATFARIASTLYRAQSQCESAIDSVYVLAEQWRRKLD